VATPLAAALPRTAAVDPPGHGASPELRWEGYELPRLAELARELLRLTASDTFIGHSWGGTVGAVLGARHPEALRALVLLDGGFVSGEARADFGLPASGDRAALVEYAREHTSIHETWGDAFAEMRAFFDDEWPEFAEALTRDVFIEADGHVRERASIEGAAAVFDALGTHDPVSCATAIREAELSTLLVVGGTIPEYREPKRRESHRFAEAGAPVVELHVDDDVGHHALLQAPERYVPLLADWLQGARVR
jgi:pimeloyl-ACP methyl ester carboxylesterase